MTDDDLTRSLPEEARRSRLSSTSVALFAAADQFRQLAEMLEGQVSHLKECGWTDEQARAMVAYTCGWRPQDGNA